MPITQKEIQKLKSIYYQEYDIELSDRQAWDIAHRLINLLKLILKIDLDEQDSDLRKKIHRV